jgi:hypothetical protein
MRFEYYHSGLADVPKLSIDGTVPHSIHFSHWEGNRTPLEVKADTSTEIALNLVGSKDFERLTQGVTLVTNNHFDTDGVLSVWTVLNGARALDLKSELIAAAEAGDFSAYTNERAVRASIVIQGSDQPVSGEEDAGSPLARHLAGETVKNDARAYELVLPEVERVLTRTDDYEPLWRDAWMLIEASLESFARGASFVEEHADVGLSVITLAPELFGPSGFKPTRHAAPFTAITHHARGQVYLIATPLNDGWSYRVDYPYYCWAETIVRPRIRRRDFGPLIARLNELERSQHGRWMPDANELASALKFLDQDGRAAASGLEPETVATEMRAALRVESQESGVKSQKQETVA